MRTCSTGLRLFAVLGLGLGASVSAHAAWKVGIGVEAGTPGGYVQVRENAIEGTPLHLRSDLGVSTGYSLRFSAIHPFGGNNALHLWLSATRLIGSSTLSRTAYFNGVTLAPGPISSDTNFQDYWRLQASYWRRLVTFPGGGGLWLSGGLTFVSLNFKINARIAPGSVGHETKEDFNTQELPVPVFGFHVRYPLAPGFALFGGVSGGHLPWTNSLRREGGMVQVTQTNEDAVLGLGYAFSAGWSARLYLFDRRYWQDERSAEDGNYVRINQHGVGLELIGTF